MLEIKYTTTAEERTYVKLAINHAFKEGAFWDYSKSTIWELLISPALFKESLEKQRIVGAEIYRLIQQEIQTLTFDIEEDIVVDDAPLSSPKESSTEIPAKKARLED